MSSVLRAIIVESVGVDGVLGQSDRGLKIMATCC